MISLKNYVEKRNGVPLGHSKSLSNMLKKSLGATSFDLFWKHWNPIWNYYLNQYVFKSLKTICNYYVAIVLTFAVSGFLHDLAGLFINKKLSFFLTTWFIIMGSIVVVFKRYQLVYTTHKKALNYFYNFLLIVLSFFIAKCLLNQIHLY